MSATWRLVRYLRPYWKLAVLAPLLMLLEVVMDLQQPRLVERIVDVGIANLDMALVWRTGLLMIGLALVGAVGGATNGICAAKVAFAVGGDLRKDLFGKVQSMSFANLDAIDTGQIITRLTSDATQVQDTVHTLLRILVRAPLLLVGGLVMSIITAPSLAYIPLGLMPILLAAIAWIVGQATPLYTTIQGRLDRLNEVLQENLAGVRVVKAFVRSAFERKRFGRASANLRDDTIRATRLVAVTMPIMMLTLNLGTVAVLWLGGAQVTDGSMHVGQIVAFVNYLARTLASLMMVSMLIVQVSRATASAVRIQEILESEPAVSDLPHAADDTELTGHVRFDHVMFDYDGDGSDPALQDITFEAKPGRTVAILGATGSGKSTLVHLIPRFYDVTQGRVLVDGVDVRDMDSETLRRQIGIALQESVLFGGTIRDNIRYADPDATQERVEAAARAAQAHEFILGFPDGYDSIVGQRGVNLSGGQKQRIAIARALLPRPAILILDDSTSSVDVETEAAIEEALAADHWCGTAIVIAQRISTVLNADKILVLDGGTIVAEGTHAELLDSSPVYRDIFDSQLGDGGNGHGGI